MGNREYNMRISGTVEASGNRFFIRMRIHVGALIDTDSNILNTEKHKLQYRKIQNFSSQNISKCVITLYIV